MDAATVRRKLAELGIELGKSQSFRFIDLFAGIGGMRSAFEALGGICVLSSEWDISAQQTYQHNHGELPRGDITKIQEADIPQHDLLVGGFPCQAFSLAYIVSFPSCAVHID